jgi:hypothetical protein
MTYDYWKGCHPTGAFSALSHSPCQFMVGPFDVLCFLLLASSMGLLCSPKFIGCIFNPQSRMLMIFRGGALGK